MRTLGSLLASMMVGVLGGCGDDAVGAGADGTGTTGEPMASTGEPPGLDSSGGDEPAPACTRDQDCSDGDPCTADVCDAGTCTTDGAVLSNECRPLIDVEVPARGATIRSASPVVTVAGSVRSEVGAIEQLRINGQSVPVGANGRFSHEVVARTGGNTLVLETIDSTGLERRRVQSFLWSTGYHLPTEAPAGILTDGLAIFLAQESIDDGDHSLPVDDLATLLGLAMGAIDLAAFIDPSVPMATAAGYDVYVLDLWSTASDVSLAAFDGGLRMTATLYGVEGDLYFDGLISSGGGFTVQSVTATVDVLVDVGANNQLAIAVMNPNTTVSGLDLWTNNGFTNFLLTIIEPLIVGGVVADLEASLTDQLTGLMGPAVGLALGAMAPNTTLQFPRIGSDTTIPVRLRTDFHQVEFDDGLAPPDPPPPQGGDLVERGGAYALVPVTPHENLGVPDWAGCGAGAPEIPLLRQAPLEIALTDDLLNQLLFGAWRGGLLEFEMPPELLPADSLLISGLAVKVSGMLAPTASDCGDDGRLRLHIGDIRIDGSLVLGELPITFVAYSSLVAGLDVVPTAAGIGITLAEVEQIETELTVAEPGGIEAEPTLRAVLEAQLVDGVLGSIGGGGLGGIDLPQLDLSATLGLPPGSAAIQVVAEDAVRAPGTTIVLGHL
jgi:hypothetical protein